MLGGEPVFDLLRGPIARCRRRSGHVCNWPFLRISGPDVRGGVFRTAVLPLVGGKLVTGIPWPPGRAGTEVHLRAPQRRGQPAIRSALPTCPAPKFNCECAPRNPTEVACNLPSLPGLHPGELVFGSNAQDLPAGTRHSRRPGTPADALDGPGSLGSGRRSGRPDCGGRWRHNVGGGGGKNSPMPRRRKRANAPASRPAGRSRQRERRAAATSSPSPERPRGTR